MHRLGGWASWGGWAAVCARCRACRWSCIVPNPGWRNSAAAAAAANNSPVEFIPCNSSPAPFRSGRAIKTVHEAADGFKLEKAPTDQPAANGVAH